MYLLDTVVISELRKKRPSTHVVRWIGAQRSESLFLSVVSLGEIERGIELRRVNAPEDSTFTKDLAHWLESLTQHYADRLLPITPAIARRWGQLSAKLGHDGADLLIAASAQVHQLTVVTRNTRHFEPSGVAVVNPFETR